MAIYQMRNIGLIIVVFLFFYSLTDLSVEILFL